MTLFLDHPVSSLPIGTLLTLRYESSPKGIVAIVTPQGVVVISHPIAGFVGRPVMNVAGWPDYATSSSMHAMWDLPVCWYIVYVPVTVSNHA